MQSSLLLTQRTCSCSGAFGSRRPRQQQQQQQAIARAHGTTQQCSSDSLPAAGSLLLAAAAAATALQVCLPALAALPEAAAAAAASSSSSSSNSGQLRQPWQPVLGEMSLTAAAAPGLQQQQDEEDQFDDDLTAQVALPPELMQFMQLTQKGEVKDLRRLQEARRSVGFERSLDGRVFLLSEDGEPFQVKADMGVPGLLLLRDAGGYCYFIPPPEENRLVQIDLSDDAIVAQLFANHAWEELVEPLEVQEEADASPAASAAPSGGRLQQLRLTERQFRSVVSLAAGAQELPEEPLEDLDQQEQQR